MNKNIKLSPRKNIRIKEAEKKINQSQDIDANIYQVNQIAMSKMEPMSKDEIKRTLNLMVDFTKEKSDTYFMLLCHENRDYTIFHFNQENSYTKLPEEMELCLANRGIIIDIDYADETKQAFEIWIKNIEGEAHCYFFFPYDLGVIDI